MNNKKELIENYLQGNLCDTERETLLKILHTDSLVEQWMRTDIELSSDTIPDTVKNHVFDAVVASDSGKESGVSIIRMFASYKRYMAVACVAMLFVLLGGGVFFLGQYAGQQPHQGMMSVSTNIGERSSVVLPDGTRVTMNAQTQMQYDCSMSANERRVYVNGEAYFDVAKDEKHPFVVYCDDLKVICLGTSFNVRNYDNENDISVVLAEGKVGVSVNDTYLTMESNNKAVYNKTTQDMKVQQVRAADYTCWLNNEIRYNNNTLEEIAQELARNYHIDMVITSDKLKQERFTGYLGRCSLRSVLDILTMTSNMNYHIEQDTVVYIYERN